MNSYTGLHATVYDEIYGDKPYDAEARFVHELARAPGTRLLDVACGTGRHALAFADLGYDVTGVDINDELLLVAREAAGDRVRFLVGDMRDLRVDGGPFDIVTCLFDSIGYAQDNDGAVAALSSMGRQATSGGSWSSSSCMLQPCSVGRPRPVSGDGRCETAEPLCGSPRRSSTLSACRCGSSTSFSRWTATVEWSGSPRSRRTGTSLPPRCACSPPRRVSRHRPSCPPTGTGRSTTVADAVQQAGDSAERARLVAAGEERARSWTAEDYVRGLIAFLDEFEQERRLWA